MNISFFKRLIQNRPQAILILLTVLIYGYSLTHGFTGDDYLNVVDNQFIKSWKNVHRMFDRSYLTPTSQLQFLKERDIGAGEVTYRPVVTLTYFIDYSLWKLQPFGYHLTNLLLHVGNVLLFFVLARFFIQDTIMAFLASVLFSAHPIETEVVLSIGFREDLLAFLFLMVSFILYLKAQKENKQRPRQYVLSYLFYGLALFSKESAIILPLLIFVYDKYFILNRESLWQRLKTRYAGYAVVSLFYLWVWAFPMARPTDYIASYAGGHIGTNLLTMIKVVGIYIWWLILPLNVHMTKPDPAFVAYSLFDIKVLAALFIIVFFLFYLFKVRKTSRIIFFSFVWFFIALLPVLNIIPIQNIIACRYLYLPSAGFFLGLALMVQMMVQSRLVLKRPLLLLFFKVLIWGMLVLYAVLNVLVGYVWKNEVTFRLDMVHFYPKDGDARLCLSNAYANIGLKKQSKRQLMIAKNLDPTNSKIYSQLGDLYLNDGKLEEARAYFQQAYKLDPQNSAAQNGFCVIMAMQEQYAAATQCFNQILALNHQNFDAYFNLGVVYWHQNQLAKSEELMLKALAIQPFSSKAKGALEDIRKTISRSSSNNKK